MKYCSKCGKILDDSAIMCPSCGMLQPTQNEQQTVPQQQYPILQQPNPLQISQMDVIEQAQPTPAVAAAYRVPTAPAEKKPSAVPFLIWSILLVFVINPVGMIISVIGAVYAAVARSCEERDEIKHNLSISKKLCITATCIDGVFILINLVVLLLTIIHSGSAL